MNVRKSVWGAALAAALLLTSAFAGTPQPPTPGPGGSPGATETPGAQTVTTTPGAPADTTPTPSSTQTPLYVIFVMEFGPSMEMPIAQTIPPQLADIASRLKTIEQNPDYIKAVQTLDAQLAANPNLAKAKADNIAASQATDQWLTDNGYENPFVALGGQGKFVELMDQIGCKKAESIASEASTSINPIYMRYFSDYSSIQGVTIDQVVATVDQVCRQDKITPTKAQNNQIKTLLAFVADPDYQKLWAARIKTNQTLLSQVGTLYGSPEYATAAQQIDGLAGGQPNAYQNLYSQRATLEYQTGIPTGLTMAGKAGQILGQTALLDRRATGRVTQLDAVLFHYQTLEIIRDYGTASPLTWFSNLLYRAGNNMGDALQKAIDDMPAERRDRPALIMLLDAGTPDVGMSDSEILSAIPPKARERNVTICSVGLGRQESDTPSSLLKGLADQTGGRYLHVSGEDAGVLLGFVVACRQSLIGDVLTQFTGTIKQGETVEAGRINVAGTKQVNVTLTYIEGRVGMDLVDPSGKTVDVSYKGTTNLTDQNTQMVTIADPQPGAWVVRLTGEQAPDTGTAYSVVVSADKSAGPSWVVWVAIVIGAAGIGGAAYLNRNRLIALMRKLPWRRAVSPPSPTPV